MTPANRLAILYQDDHVVVVNKPGGLLSVSGRGPHKQAGGVNRLKALLPSCLAQPALHRQLQRHAAHELGLNCPMINAPLYGRGQDGDALMLHAAHLSFSRPAHDKRVSFISTPLLG
ncbi:MAG: hypothetical protein KKD73_02970 [Proteobacteria bacterium]|nr:hypothetical protein [Pseudomonadota bacterium]MBU1638924.1 hypothetical protein [Pseudomonadota bacterium]